LDVDGATAHATWEKERAQCIGNVVLRTTAPIQEEVGTIQDPKMLWNCILALYGAVTLTSIYKEFRTITTMTFNLAQHPAPQLDKMQAAFSRLLASSMPVPDPMQGLILLNQVPNRWEHLIPIITQNFDVEDLNFKEVCDAILAQWESEQNWNKGKFNNNPQHANKLSAVKRKHGDPHFSQQQGNRQNNNNQNQNNDNHQRGNRGKGKGKGKGKDCQDDDHQHSHLANVASAPPPSSTTVIQVTPRGLTKCRETVPLLTKRSKGPYQSLNKAYTLADHLGVTPTIQTTKNIEQHVTATISDPIV
jgi:gag-polypeptide of LTR copia-type